MRAIKNVCTWEAEGCKDSSDITVLLWGIMVFITTAN